MKKMKIDAYLWSSPDLKHWKRLSLFWFFLPILFYRFIVGKPVLLGCYALPQDGGQDAK